MVKVHSEPLLIVDGHCHLQRWSEVQDVREELEVLPKVRGSRVSEEAWIRCRIPPESVKDGVTPV